MPQFTARSPGPDEITGAPTLAPPSSTARAAALAPQRTPAVLDIPGRSARHGGCTGARANGMCPSSSDGVDRVHAQLQREVLCYLLEHLEAKDTVEGIMHWWLPGPHSPVRPADLSAALDELVLRGWITATARGHGPALYGLDRTRLREVREFLELSGGAAED